ncbi:hypothetical protein E3N88_41574 [Mikania micrantha]|uniref:Uncharacterized protein n=1 Tax=Mikania micrantha TaxID=192012 RepID=A0A5N6LMJ8_9ASTR|nr:hypothetical protein E3N88_41574 [Mikania micrantha]
MMSRRNINYTRLAVDEDSKSTFDPRFDMSAETLDKVPWKSIGLAFSLLLFGCMLLLLSLFIFTGHMEGDSSQACGLLGLGTLTFLPAWCCGGHFSVWLYIHHDKVLIAVIQDQTLVRPMGSAVGPVGIGQRWLGHFMIKARRRDSRPAQVAGRWSEKRDQGKSRGFAKGDHEGSSEKSLRILVNDFQIDVEKLDETSELWNYFEVLDLEEQKEDKKKQSEKGRRLKEEASIIVLEEGDLSTMHEGIIKRKEKPEDDGGSTGTRHHNISADEQKIKLYKKRKVPFEEEIQLKMTILREIVGNYY